MNSDVLWLIFEYCDEKTKMHFPLTKKLLEKQKQQVKKHVAELKKENPKFNPADFVDGHFSANGIYLLRSDGKRERMDYTRLKQWSVLYTRELVKLENSKALKLLLSHAYDLEICDDESTTLRKLTSFPFVKRFGLSELDLDVVQTQTNSKRILCMLSLIKHNGDIVSSIIDLTS